MTSGLHFIIPGRPPAKSNSYQIVKIGKFYRLARTKEVRAYEELVSRIAGALAEKIQNPVYPSVDVELVIIWHRSDRRRKDLSNIAKAIEDGLTKGGMWHDDSQVKRLLLESTFDAEREEEWVEIYVMPLNELCTSGAGPAPSVLAPVTTGKKSGSVRTRSSGLEEKGSSKRGRRSAKGVGSTTDASEPSGP